ncbi:MAG: D-alanyl-D-alanine carboxypeptidase family protein [Propionibacteriaceae bacterium]|nr:D-alanyl-D-alanine carboxypeptidase family protein [Propionibacteriaceae bacterium]
MLYFGAFDSQPESLTSPQPDSSTFQPPPAEQEGSRPEREPGGTESDNLSGQGDDTESTDVPGAPGHLPESLSEADGKLPTGATVFDDHPAIANLNPDFRKALRAAARDAERDGVVLYISSGWRSAEYQKQLLQEYIAVYGSEAEAAKWAAPADKSLHVFGEAIDLDSAEAEAWLSGHGADFGLCQVYENEPWHYELRPEAKDQGCPELHADATHDPRLR